MSNLYQNCDDCDKGSFAVVGLLFMAIVGAVMGCGIGAAIMAVIR